jgi:hypothetical protein
MPLVIDSLVKEIGGSGEDLKRYVLIIEDRPAVYFGRTSDNQKFYPLLVIVKALPFTDTRLDLAKEKAVTTHADIAMLADRYIQSSYDKLFDSRAYRQYFATISSPSIPIDDSPFYFAKEPVLPQMVILLETVLGISAVLDVLLILHARKKDKDEYRFQLSSSLCHIHRLGLYVP